MSAEKHIFLLIIDYGLIEFRLYGTNFFEIDRFHIALAAMNSLYKQGKIKVKMVSELINKYKIDSNKINPLKR